MGGRRVLLLALGSRGDVEPAARLAHALRRRGADVAVAVLADGAERVRRAGARAVVVGPPSAQAMWWRSPLARGVAGLNPGLGYLEMRTSLSRLAPRALDAVVPWLGRVDLVVSGLATALTVPVLRSTGIPARLVLHCPAVPHPGGTSVWGGRLGAALPSVVEGGRQALLWRLTEGLSQGLARGLARRLGVAGDLPAGSPLPTGAPLLATSPVLDPDPSPQLLQTGPWRDPTPPRPVPPALDDWLRRHPGALLLTLGSLPVTRPERQLDLLLGAAADTGRPAVVQVPGVPHGPRPGGIVVGEVDHRTLLPRVAAVVHHGGSGTTHAVTAAGLPQVVLPHLGDQGHYARQVHRLGAAPAPLPALAVTRRGLAERLGRALDDPGTAAAADAASARLAREDGLGVAVDELLGATR